MKINKLNKEIIMIGKKNLKRNLIKNNNNQMRENSKKEKEKINLKRNLIKDNNNQMKENSKKENQIKDIKIIKEIKDNKKE